MVFNVWLSLIFSCTAIRLASRSKYPFDSPAISSISIGTGETASTAWIISWYPSTSDYEAIERAVKELERQGIAIELIVKN